MTPEQEDRIRMEVSIKLNGIRSLVIECETLLRSIHNARYPMPKPSLDLTPTEPLDPVIRAEIDATP